MSFGTQPDFGTTKDSITLNDFLAKYNGNPVEELDFLAPRKTITGKFVPNKKENETMSFGTMEQREKLTKELTKDIYRHAYQDGVEEGRNEAWEVFKTIHKFAPYCFLDCFPNGNDELYSLSIHEIIRRVREYKEKKQETDEIKVGDVVKMNGHSAVITWCYGDYWNGICVQNDDNDASEVGMTYYHMKYDGWTKTGETIPEIVKMLRK